tara:strand:- start:59 stop:958 length:900 start_codon:yes stop_codon:yes gene_type:complete
MAKDDGWGTVEIPESQEDKVEYEIEENKEEDPKELEGIETKGAEKRIRQLVKQRKEREEQIEQLRQQNEQLKQVVNTKSTEVTEMNKLSLNASEKQLQDKIELARAVYLEAFDEGNKEKVLQAQEMLNEAQGDLKSVSLAKRQYEREDQQKAQQPVRSQPQIQQKQISDPKAQEWASNNDWFGKDNVMTAAALAIDAELKGEGYSPDDQDFYTEVDKRIRKSFPQKFGEDQERVQETTSSPAQVVSGSSRSSPTSRSKVKLSQEDIRLAQKWNIPLEKYAAEKLKVNQAEGEYTDIYRS